MRRFVAAVLYAVTLALVMPGIALGQEGAFLLVDGDEVSWAELSLEDGVLTGTIHDAHAGSILGESVTPPAVSGRVAFNDGRRATFTGTLSGDGFDIEVTDATGTQRLTYAVYEFERDEYYLLENNEQTGPYTLMDLMKFTADGNFKAETVMWRAGFPAWTTAQHIPELGYSVNVNPPEVDVAETAPPPADNGRAEWYVIANGEQVGPMTLTAARERLANGQSGPADLVWWPGLTDWTRADAVAELAQNLTPVPPPLPPPETQPKPQKPVDPSCEGASVWLEATKARFDQVDELREEGAEALQRADIDAYRASLGRFSVEVSQIRARQTAESVPAVASHANTTALEVLGLLVTAATGLDRFFGGAGGQPLYSKAMGALQDADDLRSDLDVAITVVETTCG